MKMFDRLSCLFIALCMLISVSGYIYATDINEIPIEKVSDTLVFSEDVYSEIVNNCAVLTYVDEVSFKETKPVSRIPELEELNTYVFQNADGTHTMYLLDENVKYVAFDGSVHEKDVSLVKINNGYTTRENNIGLMIPDNPEKGISLSYGNCRAVLIPQKPETDLSQIGRTEEENDYSILYNDFFGKGIDLRYTATLSGVKEDIILSSYTGINSFVFLVETNGLYVYENDNRYYLAENEESEERIYLGSIVVYDRMGKPDFGSMIIETIESGSKYQLTVSANESFLIDPETVYPVTIDPTLTISDTVTGTNSIQDAPVFQNKATMNFGTFQYNTIGQADTNYGVGRTAVYLSGLVNSTIYNALADSTQITSVKFYIKEATGTAAKNICLYRMKNTESWTESTVTWNNLGLYETGINWGGSLSNGEWTFLNITSLVQGWKSGSYKSPGRFVMVMSGTESASYKQFDSSEITTTANRPYVVFSYAAPITINRLASTYLESELYQKDLQFKQNCYGYAIQVYQPEGIPILQSNGLYRGYLQQPGDFAGDAKYTSAAALDAAYGAALKKGSQSLFDFTEERMMADFNNLYKTNSEWVIKETTATATVPTGYRKIAMVTLDGDFHFYMRHSSGGWSHKRGSTGITNRSIVSNVVITDSNIDNVIHELYDGPAKYYLISKSAVVEYRHSDRDKAFPATFSTALPGGNSFEKSYPIKAGISTVCIDYKGDVDYFVFTPTSSGTYTIKTTGTNATGSFNMDISVYNTYTKKLISDSLIGEASVTVTLSAGERYFIVVSAPDQAACVTYLNISKN